MAFLPAPEWVGRKSRRKKRGVWRFGGRGVWRVLLQRPKRGSHISRAADLFLLRGVKMAAWWCCLHIARRFSHPPPGGVFSDPAWPAPRLPCPARPPCCSAVWFVWFNSGALAPPSRQRRLPPCPARNLYVRPPLPPLILLFSLLHQFQLCFVGAAIPSAFSASPRSRTSQRIEPWTR